MEEKSEMLKSFQYCTKYFSAFDENEEYNISMYTSFNDLILEIYRGNKYYVSRKDFNDLKTNNKVFSSCKSIIEIKISIENYIDKIKKCKLKKDNDKYILRIYTSQKEEDVLIFQLLPEVLNNQMNNLDNSFFLNQTMMNTMCMNNQMGNMNNQLMGMNNPIGNINNQMMGMNNPMMSINNPMGNMNNQMMGMNNPMINNQMGNMNNQMMGMNNSMINDPMGNMNSPMMGMNNPMGNMNTPMMGMNNPMISKMNINMNNSMNDLNHSMSDMKSSIDDIISEKIKTAIDPYQKKIKELEEKLRQKDLEIAKLKGTSSINYSSNNFIGNNDKNLEKIVLRKKRYTNFEEMLYSYKNKKFYNPNEENLLMEFKEVYYFYREKKMKIEKEMEGKKLFMFRFKKAKELIQIYKIFELLTDAVSKIIEYNEVKSNINMGNKHYLKVIERGKKIINFKKKEEKMMRKRDPALDKIKLFSVQESDNVDPNNITKNTFLKTLNDNFENKKDCHLIRNSTINFIPQIEIIFAEDFKITKELLIDFKKELKEIFEDDRFYVIEISKGSTHFLTSLPFILEKEFNKLDKKEEYQNKIRKKVSEYVEKIKNHEFCFFGKTITGRVNGLVQDIESSKSEIIQIFKEKIKGEEVNEKTNFYEALKMFSLNDFFEVIDLCETDLQIQELAQLKKNYEEYIKIFYRDMEKALAFSIFEYQIVKIYINDRDDYEKFQQDKNNCKIDNVEVETEEKLLFHGTDVNTIASILKTFVDIDRNKKYKLGKGFYLSDLFEVSWRYRITDIDDNIPKIGDSFSVLVCDTFYARDKIDHCHKKIWKDILIPPYHLRIAKVKADTDEVISEEELIGYTGYIQNEYLISHREQVIPLYGICLRRVEHLIIWRDNNFDESNPNEYQDFEEMTKYNNEMKAYAYLELNAKIYYVNSTEEGLKLVDRKKYNKIIIVTNGGNNGKEFIDKSREIIKGNPIAYVTCYIPENHIDWVCQLPNTLLSDDREIFQDFLKNAVTENKEEMKKLKDKIEKKYGKNLNFDEESAFVFQSFKGRGEFSELKFKPEYNNEKINILFN